MGAAEKRSNYEEQFEMYCADMYINDEITRVINKGAVLEGMVEHVGGPALQGEHISLICAMMESASDDEDQHVVEVRGLIETEIDALVEAIDEETGDVLQFAIPDALVDEVRVRLEGTDPVVARVDLGSGRVTSIFPVDDVIA